MDELGARAAVRRVKRNVPWLLSHRQNREFYRAHMDAGDVEVLVDLARDGDALQFLRNLACNLHQEALGGRSVMQAPTCLYELAFEYFAYGPSKRQPSPKDAGLRHTTIAFLVKIVNRDFGFQEYTVPKHRNDKAGPMSACRLVAEELGLSESRVEKIWANRKPST